MRKRITSAKHFLCDETGLVTVEWVAIAAAVVVGAIALAWLVQTNTHTQANAVGSTISTAATATTSQTHP